MKLIRMNERILELNAQADKYAWEKVGEKYDEFGSLNRSLNWQWEDTKMEKFAELIVRECIDKITTYDLVPGHSAKWEDIYDIHVRLLQDLGEELKEHFGIEE